MTESVPAKGFPVLLVEDSEGEFRKANLAAVLDVVEDGDAAVENIAGSGQYGDRDAHPFPRLVLLDLKLPRRSGLEILRWVRASADFRKLPIVVLTSSRQDSDIERAYEIGANSYLVKPVGFEALLDMIRCMGAYWMHVSELPKPPTMQAGATGRTDPDCP